MRKLKRESEKIKERKKTAAGVVKIEGRTGGGVVRKLKRETKTGRDVLRKLKRERETGRGVVRKLKERDENTGRCSEKIKGERQKHREV